MLVCYGETGEPRVEIHEGMTTIGSSTFFECSSLKSVTLPAGVTTIDIVHSLVQQSNKCDSPRGSDNHRKWCIPYVQQPNDCYSPRRVAIWESMHSMGAAA